MNRLQEIELRLKAIGELLTGKEKVDTDALDTEITALRTEKTEIEKRQRLADGIAAGTVATKAVTEPVHRKEEAKAEWRSFGEFLGAVVRAGTGHGVDARLVESRQLGLNEGVPSEGGFLVQTDHVNELLKRTYDTGILASRVRKIPVSSTANGLVIPTINETSRATGSRWGGVQAYWLNEAGTKTASRPDFGQMELKLKKLIGLCYATDELLQDSAALEAIISQAFPEEFAWMLDNAIFRGTGAGQPFGIVGHAATIVVPAEAGQAASTILYENVLKMWSRMWARSRGNAAWFINQDIEPQLHTMSLAVGVGGVPVYMPATGASGTPYATLFGRPVIPIEQASTLGTVGDITLGDFSQYMTIDKGGIQNTQSIHVAFTTDQTAFRFVYRVDGQPAWQTALTPANGTNTTSPFVQLATRA